MVSSKQFAPHPSPVFNRRHASNATSALSAGVQMPLRPMKTDGSAGSSDSDPSLAEANPISETGEDALVKRIMNLWSDHAAQRSEVSRSRGQFRTLGLELGKEFSQYKKLLAQTGRSGKWTTCQL